jgi:ribosomal protein L6P/L9E
MSRIGKTPVLIPEKVTVDFDGLTVTVKGPKGELKRLMPEGVSFDKKDNTVVVSPTTTKIHSRQRHGLCRALIANMVEGVSQGFSKKLEIVGVGSRAQVKGKNLVVSAGYSHTQRRSRSSFPFAYRTLTFSGCPFQVHSARKRFCNFLSLVEIETRTRYNTELT